MAPRVPTLSVVIPAYNAAAFLGPRLAYLTQALETFALDYEVIVVDDGSQDGTAQVVDGLRSERLRGIVFQANRGKYAALKAGVAASRGRACIFMDADVPYELDAVPAMTHLVTEEGFHVVVGDRTLPESHYADDLSFLRRVATQAFTQFVRILVTGGLHDTQCGIKAFRGDVARALFPLVQESGFAGDVELLYIAIKHNLAIRRFPVRLEHQGGSTVRPFVHGTKMLAAISKLRVRHRLGQYASDDLRRVVRASYGKPAPSRAKVRQPRGAA